MYLYPVDVWLSLGTQLPYETPEDFQVEIV